MKVMVTGPTGFVGTHLVPSLKESGHEVWCFHRPTSDLSLLEKLGTHFVAGDVTNPATLKSAVKGMDAVIHLVAIIREEDANFEAVNVGGVENLLKACEPDSTPVVHVGALGTSEESPSGYSRSKARGERLVRESGLPHTILRPGLILGPRGDFTERFRGLVARYRKVPIVGSGRSLLQPIFVRDVVRALLASIEKAPRGETWELVGPERVTWEELVAGVSLVMGVERTIRRIPPWVAALVSRASSLVTGEQIATSDELIMMRQDVVGDASKFQKLTGMEPVGLDECLKLSFGGPPNGRTHGEAG